MASAPLGSLQQKPAATWIATCWGLRRRDVSGVRHQRFVGAVAAFRDATVFKAASAWVLPGNEVTHRQTVDFSRNRRAPQLGDLGVLQVMYGKAQRGSPPKRRPLLTVFDWSPGVLDAWIRTSLPWLAPVVSEIFPTTTGMPFPKSALHRRFSGYIEQLG